MAKTNFPAILITGATGNVGPELAKQLSARNVPYRAMVRSLKDADGFSALEGAEVVIGDFDRPETLIPALQRVERAFLLTNSSERAETIHGTIFDLLGLSRT